MFRTEYLNKNYILTAIIDFIIYINSLGYKTNYTNCQVSSLNITVIVYLFEWMRDSRILSELKVNVILQYDAFIY